MTAPDLEVLDGQVARLAENRKDRAQFRMKERRVGIGPDAGPDAPKGFTMEEIGRLWECDRTGLEIAEAITAELRAVVKYNEDVEASYG